LIIQPSSTDDIIPFLAYQSIINIGLYNNTIDTFFYPYLDVIIVNPCIVNPCIVNIHRMDDTF